ncbi:restriction endonuclease subunit S [Shewanella colwelliana]|uniref:restriction endonuclease subunit S n=1 Tax=Shewanella colwelliana TaxID=23 RepID=UPI003735F3F9
MTFSLATSEVNTNPKIWKLKDICSKIGSGATPRGGESAYLDERVEYAFVRSQNVFDFKFESSEVRFISDESAQKLKGVHLQKDDILLNITGDGITFSRCCIVDERILPAAVNQHVAIIRVNKEVCLPGYLLAFLCAPETKAYIASFNAGGSRRAITKGHIESFEIPAASLKLQEAIQNIVYSIIQKIELNRETNQTLEQMAQAIFKSWFVDFDPVKAKMNGEQPEGMDAATASLFPEKLVESELGLIPEGWNIKSIKDFGDVICGKTPSKKNADFYGGDVPFIKIPDTHGKVFITETSDTLTQAGDESQPKKRIPENSICVSCIATVGQVFITTKPSHTNQQINSVVPYDQNSLYYLLFKFKGLNKHFHDLASGGSATLNMNTSTFSKVALVRPTADVLEAFHKTVGGLMGKMLANQLENTTLSELRDTLLPKLLSGEIELDTQ